MGLEDFTRSDSDELPPDYCPTCEKKGQVTSRWYNRCDTDSCVVTSWIPADYSL